MSDIVDVLLGDSGLPIAIFPTRTEALTSPENELGRVRLDVPRNEAVDAIRREVYRLDDGRCRHCGEIVTFKTMHLDEIVSRGNLGPVAVDNCQTLCAKCHILGPESKHGKTRSVRKRKPNAAL